MCQKYTFQIFKLIPINFSMKGVFDNFTLKFYKNYKIDCQMLLYWKNEDNITIRMEFFCEL